jgi:hypothetical protein
MDHNRGKQKPEETAVDLHQSQDMKPSVSYPHTAYGGYGTSETPTDNVESQQISAFLRFSYIMALWVCQGDLTRQFFGLPEYSLL